MSKYQDNVYSPNYPALLKMIDQINEGIQYKSEIDTKTIMQEIVGPRHEEQGCGEGEQKILQAVILDKECSQIALDITLLAAGFVLGNKGESLKQIWGRTDASIRSDNYEKIYNNKKLTVRIFKITGTTEQLIDTIAIIVAAVNRYKRLLYGEYADKVVKEDQQVMGIVFKYRPPPIIYMPLSARTIDYPGKPSEYAQRKLQSLIDRKKKQFYTQFDQHYSSGNTEAEFSSSTQQGEVLNNHAQNNDLNNTEILSSIHTIHENQDQNWVNIHSDQQISENWENINYNNDQYHDHGNNFNELNGLAQEGGNWQQRESLYQDDEIEQYDSSNTQYYYQQGEGTLPYQQYPPPNNPPLAQWYNDGGSVVPHCRYTKPESEELPSKSLSPKEPFLLTHPDGSGSVRPSRTTSPNSTPNPQQPPLSPATPFQYPFFWGSHGQYPPCFLSRGVSNENLGNVQEQITPNATPTLRLTRSTPIQVYYPTPLNPPPICHSNVVTPTPNHIPTPTPNHIPIPTPTPSNVGVGVPIPTPGALMHPLPQSPFIPVMTNAGYTMPQGGFYPPVMLQGNLGGYCSWPTPVQRSISCDLDQQQYPAYNYSSESNY